MVAAFAYTSEEQDELGFEVNDRITVLPWEDSEDEVIDFVFTQFLHFIPSPIWLYRKTKNFLIYFSMRKSEMLYHNSLIFSINFPLYLYTAVTEGSK